MNYKALILSLFAAAPSLASTICTSVGGEKLTIHPHSKPLKPVGGLNEAMKATIVYATKTGPVHFSGGISEQPSFFGTVTTYDLIEMTSQQKAQLTVTFQHMPSRGPIICGRGSCDNVGGRKTLDAELIYDGQTVEFTCNDKFD